MSNQNPKSHLLKASDIEAMPETVKVHYLNPKAVRNTKSLSDAVGMKQMGVNLVRLEPGKETTEFHFHHQEDACVSTSLERHDVMFKQSGAIAQFP